MAAKRKGGANAPQSLRDVIAGCLEDVYVPGEVKGWLSTGNDLLDWALGGLGYPGGRIVEISGEEHTGKTMLALMACRSCIKEGGEAVYLDVEQGLDYGWARKNGVPPEALSLFSPANLEEVHKVVEEVVSQREKADTPTVIVVDTVASALAKAAAEADVGDTTAPAMEARLNSRFLAKEWTRRFRNSRIVLLLINQVREKLGITFGSNLTTPGGRAIRFYSAIRIRTDLSSPIMAGSVKKGIFVKANIFKSKIDVKRSVELPLYFEGGVDNIMSLIYYLDGKGWGSHGRINWNDKSYARVGLREVLAADLAQLSAFKQAAREEFFSPD